MGSYSRTERHRKALREEAFAAEHGYLRAPALVQWLATLRCPLSCPHCLAAGGEGGMEDMALADTRRLIDEAAELGVGEFLVTGGEPLARKDLPEVIEHLGRRGLPWSLNTACLPDARTRKAIEKYPPGLAAVSLDGPEAVHDAFRGRAGAFGEAMESIRYFAGVKGVQAVAGTTVTTFNYGHLSETFHVVAKSGAASWGIHLPVPEGRARDRRDLFLSRRQLGGLMRFVAGRRRYFPVSMADEFGYCGDWEPALREQPFRCGAGVAQCVVLPDGLVVPCTTLDRSTSAGNVHERTLGAIWREGFGALRRWEPTGRCKGCEYAPACQGGCWLQRRQGMDCYKGVWQVPAALKTAAGIALCLGVLGLPGTGQTTEGPGKGYEVGTEAGKRSAQGIEGEVGSGIEREIVIWYASQVEPTYRLNPDVEKEKQKEEDPAFVFLREMESGKLPEKATELKARIEAGLKTKERSLAYSALLWRAVGEWCLKHPDAPKRTAEERQAIRETLAAMEKATDGWYREIFEKKLDPYLARGRTALRHAFQMSKAIRPDPAWLELVRDTQVERWGKAGDALEEWVTRHPYAEMMRFKMVTVGLTDVERLNVSGRAAMKDGTTFGIYDVLVTPKGERVKVGLMPNKLRTVWVELPADAELTYIDVLGLAYAQHAESRDEEVKKTPGRIGEIDPLQLGAVLKLEGGLMTGDVPNVDLPHSAQGPRDQTLRSVKLWLADFWMF